MENYFGYRLKLQEKQVQILLNLIAEVPLLTHNIINLVDILQRKSTILLLIGIIKHILFLLVNVLLQSAFI